jgi:hypothetical protein
MFGHVCNPQGGDGGSGIGVVAISKRSAEGGDGSNNNPNIPIIMPTAKIALRRPINPGMAFSFQRTGIRARTPCSSRRPSHSAANIMNWVAGSLLRAKKRNGA